jgi:predicted MFS family arabinose efflux permease
MRDPEISPTRLWVGGVVVDTLGIQWLFWGGGALLALAGVLGLVLLGTYDFRQELNGRCR